MNINGEELILLIIIAVIVIGPERLPAYAEQLGEMVRNLKKMATGATERVKEELGEEAEDLDLSQFDPRQYDPRRIVREALADDVLPPSRPARPARRTTSTRPTPSEAATARKERLAQRTAEAKERATGSDAVAAATGAGTTAVADATTAASVATSGASARAGETVPADEVADHGGRTSGNGALPHVDEATPQEHASQDHAGSHVHDGGPVPAGAPFDDEAT